MVYYEVKWFMIYGCDSGNMNNVCKSYMDGSIDLKLWTELVNDQVIGGGIMFTVYEKDQSGQILMFTNNESYALSETCTCKWTKLK